MTDKRAEAELRMLGSMILSAKHATDAATAAFSQYLATVQPGTQGQPPELVKTTFMAKVQEAAQPSSGESNENDT